MLRRFKNRRFVIIFSSIILVIIIGTTVIYSLQVGQTPISRLITNIQSSGCKSLAEKLLTARNSEYPFHRCEKKTYKVSDSQKAITRIYVVAGGVERHWEFECGYFEACTRYIGWFDDHNQLFDFIEPPAVANHDPAVYTLGCGEPNSSSIYDIEVEPKLVFEQNKFWWRIAYNKTPTDSQNTLCKVSGISLNGYKSVLSNVQTDYLFNIESCDSNKPTACQSAKAIKDRSVQPCYYNNPTYNAPYSDFHPGYDGTCLSNYVTQTGDQSACDIKTVYGSTVACNEIVVIKKL